MPFDSLGRMLLVLGLVIAAVGVGMMLLGRTSLLGNLPGDFTFERDGVRIYLPLGTGIVISIILTIVLNLVFGLIGRR